MPLLAALERIADALVESKQEQILDDILRHDAQNELKRNAKQARDMVVEGLVAGTLQQMCLGIKSRLKKFLDLEPLTTPDAVRERVFGVYFKADPIVAEALVIIALTLIDKSTDLTVLQSLCAEYALRKQRVALMCEACNAQRPAGAGWTLTPTDATPMLQWPSGKSVQMWDIVREVRAKDAKGRDAALNYFLESDRHTRDGVDPSCVMKLLGADVEGFCDVVNTMVTVRSKSFRDAPRPPDAFIGLCADEYTRQRFWREKEPSCKRVMLAALTWLLTACVIDCDMPHYAGGYNSQDSYRILDTSELRAALEDASIAAKEALARG